MITMYDVVDAMCAAGRIGTNKIIFITESGFEQPVPSNEIIIEPRRVVHHDLIPGEKLLTQQIAYEFSDYMRVQAALS